MNRIANSLTHAVMIVAALAAIVIAMPVQAAGPDAAQNNVIVMPRVQVTGHRELDATVRIVQLPRVTVTGHRLEGTETRQARRDPAPAKHKDERVALL